MASRSEVYRRGGTDGSFWNRPNSFPCGSLHVTNQPMPEDRQIPGPGITFHPDLVTQVREDALGAPVANPLQVQVRHP